MAVNLYGPIYAMRKAVQVMLEKETKERKYGILCNKMNNMQINMKKTLDKCILIR